MRNQLLWIQAAIVLVCMFLGLILHGVQASVAAAYGAGIAFVQILALMARSRYAARVEAGPRGMLWMAALSFLERILLIAGLLLLGLKGFHLAPQPLLLGLVAGQIGFLWAGLHYRLR